MFAPTNCPVLQGRAFVEHAVTAETVSVSPGGDHPIDWLEGVEELQGVVEWVALMGAEEPGCTGWIFRSLYPTQIVFNGRPSAPLYQRGSVPHRPRAIFHSTLPCRPQGRTRAALSAGDWR